MGTVIYEGDKTIFIGKTLVRILLQNFKVGCILDFIRTVRAFDFLLSR